MSFEVFLQCFRGGVGASAPLAAVRGAFSHFAEDSEPDCWRLRYDERNSCDVYVTPRGDRVEGFMVSRPCADLRLWDSLYRVLQLGPWVLYFPSAEPSLVVADLAHVKELPPDMVETLGPARRVGSGREIWEIIAGSEGRAHRRVSGDLVEYLRCRPAIQRLSVTRFLAVP